MGFFRRKVQTARVYAAISQKWEDWYDALFDGRIELEEETDRALKWPAVLAEAEDDVQAALVAISLAGWCWRAAEHACSPGLPFSEDLEAAWVKAGIDAMEDGSGSDLLARTVDEPWDLYIPSSVAEDPVTYYRSAAWLTWEKIQKRATGPKIQLGADDVAAPFIWGARVHEVDRFVDLLLQEDDPTDATA